jgi:hypothetical protein
MKQVDEVNADRNILPEDASTLNYYRSLFMAENKSRVDFYNQSVKLILTIPLFINAGGAIALASFFNKNPNETSLYIRHAAIWFIAGTILGILTLVFEYFAIHFEWVHYTDHINSFKDKAGGTPQGWLEVFKTYFDNSQTRFQNLMTTIRLRIFNGSLSIISCFVGIYYIAGYVLSDWLLIWQIPSAIIIIAYTLCSLFCMYEKLRIK